MKRVFNLRSAAGVVVSGLLAACTADLNNVGGENVFANGEDLTQNVSVSCSESDQDFFNRAVWPTLSTTCVGCHAQNNVSGNDAPDLVYPNSAVGAFESVRSYIVGHSDLLANKPTMNGVGHSGGRVLSLEDSAVSALAEMVVRVEEPAGGCLDTGGTAARELGFTDVTNISRSRTVRKAAILLQGRMPTNAEITLAQTDDAGLKTVLSGYLEGDSFDAWLKNSANDHLLTRKYVTGQTEAQEALSADTYNYVGLYDRTQAAFNAADAAEVACANASGTPSETAPQQECVDAYNARQISGVIYQETQRAIAEEPLELIRYVVSNNRPYSEILTADYMMMNPFTYEVLDGATWSEPYDDMDATDWRPAHIRRYNVTWNTTLQAKTGKAYVPSAGVLSSPVFLARYPSTDTNRNRARARWTYYYFLGVDIERLAVRAMDPEELKNVTNPGAEGSSCFGCHLVMDPVAGAFQSWGNSSQFLVRNGDDSLPQVYVDSHADYLIGDQWYRGQIRPGFNGLDMPTTSDFGMNSSHEDGLQWLAAQLVQDNRFATGTAQFWFKGLFGRDPLLSPTATDDADFQARLDAYQDEQALIQAWADAFRANDLNLKTLLVEMMMSPLFRGEQATQIDENRLAALDQLGIGRLLTPEQLERKVIATTGFVWKQDWQQSGQLLEDYYMFYGGIDSDGITKRPESLNSLMYSVAERMANEISCEIVAQAFWPGMTSPLFAGLEITTDPTTTEGEAAIRSALRNLLWRFWGVDDQTEEDALWGLYKALYDERIALSNASDFLNADEANNEEDEFCRFRDYDETDGVNITLNWGGITDWGDVNNVRANIGSYYNPEQTLRPWVGVLTAMFTDIQFVTE